MLLSLAAEHHDHRAVVVQRLHWWNAVVDEVMHEGTTTVYVANAAPHAVVEAPTMVFRKYGVEEHARGMVQTIAAGVCVHLTGIVASAGVAIIEADYENPADDPHHCPATHTEVRCHPMGRTTRIILFYTFADDRKPIGATALEQQQPARPQA